MRRYTTMGLFGVLVTTACDATRTLSPDIVQTRSNTVVCIGVDGRGLVHVVPIGPDGGCPAGYDLKPWT
jgi:hypothetical protein